jgi:hypothetical protein
MRILETNVTLVKGVGDELGVSYTQEIPDEYLQELNDRFVGTNDLPPKKWTGLSCF